MDKGLHYIVQIGSINGIECITIIDKKTGKYLKQQQLEEWVELVGGVIIYE